MVKNDTKNSDAEIMRLINAYARSNNISDACAVRNIIACDTDFKSYCEKQGGARKDDTEEFDHLNL